MDGIETEVGDEAEIVRLDLRGTIGRQTARLYDVRVVPTTLLFDGGGGEVIYRNSGKPEADRIVEIISSG